MKLLFSTVVAAFLNLSITAQTQIKFYTTLGDFVVEMSDSLTPITSGNFISLTEEGYYDGIIFHRVIDDFMIQGGDPTGTGSGGPGYTIEDEFDSTGTLSNIQKTISMANTGQPNSGGSQFFINLVDNTYLDYDKPPLTSKHPVFGMVIENFDVVQDIGNVSVNAQNRPITDVVMDSLRVMGNDTVDSVPEDDTPPEGIVNAFGSLHELKIFPNPVMNEALIRIEVEKAQEVQFKVLDATGREAISFNRTLRAGVNRIPFAGLNQNHLPAGIYILTVNLGKRTFSQRFVLAE
ncbi:MAG: peptidylprolyl isomerase [Salibacteraceae bacterium]